MTLLEFHVVISLIEMVAGLIMLYGLVSGTAFGAWTALFLATAILTSLSGFPLAPFGFDPPRAIGILTLVLLAVAVSAYYVFRLAGAWRWIYVVTAIAALYLDVFVGVFQSFLKIPAVHALAPTQSEPPFFVAQAAVLVLFVVLGFFAVRKFHPASAPMV
jgi:hypothetical protein